MSRRSDYDLRASCVFLFARAVRADARCTEPRQAFDFGATRSARVFSGYEVAHSSHRTTESLMARASKTSVAGWIEDRPTTLCSERKACTTSARGHHCRTFACSPCSSSSRSAQMITTSAGIHPTSVFGGPVPQDVRLDSRIPSSIEYARALSTRTPLARFRSSR